MSEPITFLNGRFVPLSQARLSVFDQGLVHGAGVSELMRTFKHKVFRLDEHLQRLWHSMTAVGFSLTLTPVELAEVVEEVVATNTARIGEPLDVGVTVFVTGGLNASYVGARAAVESGCSVGVHTFPLQFDMYAVGMRDGRRLVTPSVKHMPVDVIDARIKSRSRLPLLLADREARSIDPQSRALLLDANGNVTETTTCNFFIVKDGCIRTAPGPKVLEGISRGVVLEEIATEIPIDCEQAEFDLAHVLSSDEAFTTSTPYCLMPVSHVNGLPIGDGTP
ncbi:MAG: aminotransferase class IV, partial [Planctomycetota bacterium]|nr:aminotransferase class IV [Planctomycetota bacterium]